MSMVILYEDSEKEYLEVTPTSTKVLTFYEDKEGVIKSTKLLGKYCKETIYSFEKSSILLLLELKRRLNEDIDTLDIIDLLLDDPHTKSYSVTIDFNKFYNPREWQKLYGERAEAIAIMEKDTGFNVW